jgi:uncharacterized protein (DUF2384 family)
MSSSALEKIAAIQERATKEIEALKAEAISDIAKKLSDAKAVVAELEYQYSELTGKTLKGERAKRVRLSPEQSAALIIKVGEIIQSAKDGINMGNIVKQAGASDSAVRKAVSLVKGVKKTGNKASTLYFFK